MFKVESFKPVVGFVTKISTTAPLSLVLVTDKYANNQEEVIINVKDYKHKSSKYSFKNS